MQPQLKSRKDIVHLLLQSILIKVVMMKNFFQFKKHMKSLKTLKEELLMTNMEKKVVNLEVWGILLICLVQCLEAMIKDQRRQNQ